MSEIEIAENVNEVLENEIHNLVFEGGGIRGIAYAGAYKYLEENGLTDNVRNIAGSSAGAITAGLLAVGFSSGEIKDILNGEIDYDEITDSRKCFGRCYGFFKNYGLYKGEYFEEIYGKILAKKTQNPNITFKEVFEKYGIKLYITATNLNKQKVEYFCPDLTPDIELKCAVRISMSVPLLFEFKKCAKLGGDIYVDGGLLNNYPINLFQDDMEHTLGLKLVTPDEQENDEVWHGDNEINSIADYSVAILNSMLTQIERGWIKDNYWERTVTICTGNISSFNFDIPDEVAQELFDNGYNCTKEWFQNN